MDLTPVIIDAAAYTGGTRQPYTYQVAGAQLTGGKILDKAGQEDVYLRHDVSGKTHDALKLPAFQKLFDANGDGRWEAHEVAGTLEAADKEKDGRITAKELLGLAYKRGIIKP